MEDCHVLAPCPLGWIDCRPVSARGDRRRAARCRRTLHLAGLLVLPARQRLSERIVEGPPRRARARLPCHLLGSPGLQGSVLDGGGDRPPGRLWPPLRRRLLYARDRG